METADCPLPAYTFDGQQWEMQAWVVRLRDADGHVRDTMLRAVSPAQAAWFAAEMERDFAVSVVVVVRQDPNLPVIFMHSRGEVSLMDFCSDQELQAPVLLPYEVGVSFGVPDLDDLTQEPYEGDEDYALLQRVRAQGGTWVSESFHKACPPDMWDELRRSFMARQVRWLKDKLVECGNHYLIHADRSSAWRKALMDLLTCSYTPVDIGTASALRETLPDAFVRVLHIVDTQGCQERFALVGVCVFGHMLQKVAEHVDQATVRLREAWDSKAHCVSVSHSMSWEDFEKVVHGGGATTYHIVKPHGE